MNTHVESGLQRASRRRQLGDTYRECLSTWPGRVFFAGSAFIILHLADDAFLEVAPGVSPVDHLTGGGGMIAVMLLAVLAWPFLRPAGRAATALILGILAASAGVMTHGEALADGRVSLNHLSGALMVIGGLALVVLGVVLTHRSIAKPVRRNLRWAGRRLLAAVAIYLVLVYLCVPVLTAIYVTHPQQSGIAAMDLGVAYENVTFTTNDGLRLAGWFIPSSNGATIIATPGAGSDRTNIAGHAAMLARHGYGVLLFDPRGTGESQGDPNHYGWSADNDIRAALVYLQSRPDVDPDRIGAFGLSMGGEASIEATARSARIQAVVAEGVGARTVEEERLQSGVSATLGLPATWLGMTLTAALSGTAPPASLADLVQQVSPRPLLLIYASRSQQAGESQLNPRYFRAAGEPKELWAITEGGHVDGLTVQPEEYEARVIRFFDQALLAGSMPQ